ncbi:hypothetical protein SEVIR_5G077300v4 [Setaria viridis]|uniref:LEAF RUST 10 DISEASE-RESISTANCEUS RECEPTOR-LIKE PROTEIN KINASE-like 2.4 isoform X2 n=1 Tax=Setaria viridis TaxID=4556 RepID=UPI001493561F|nr:LEAF RUST 10 DISEASE-RESISTANCE LOCUS RECEPTOR-LIKE PROTEIN KINASE-like 1.5 isoform X2 [Setaria viridis]
MPKATSLVIESTRLSFIHLLHFILLQPCNGDFWDVSSPFRRRGDPPDCGVQSYELACTDDEATIRIGRGTYNVVSINYTASNFWVVESNLGAQSSCLLPRWSHHALEYMFVKRSRRSVELAPSRWRTTWATFVNCSQPIENNGMYKPVACLSTNSSFIYVITGLLSSSAENFELSCGYLAMTPLGAAFTVVPNNASYADIVKLISKGFAVRFSYMDGDFRQCLAEATSEFHEPTDNTGIKDRIVGILFVDSSFWRCIIEQFRFPHSAAALVLIGPAIAFPTAMWFLKFIIGTSELYTHHCIVVIFNRSFLKHYPMYINLFYAVICRFVLAPLAMFTFLAHMYWKTRITMDAVEKFLRMQQILNGPLRYAYTDIVAITSHFREKLGQGGYGSVYKGVLLPGNVHIAVKMLENSNCNGEEFISEVATIGRIHHVNVVRLVGFCSEEMRRALLYEYMPNGSLDKYIFSSEKRFSWDKLDEIALGIARGINYLHQGCDMRILHFDIKPHNILLDNNFVPKVADFGLAKIFPRDNSFVPMSAMRGTIGYIAPEMVSRSFGIISSKSDVYSFGMLLLEMAGGHRNTNPHAATSSQAYYPSWVYSRLSQHEVGEITDVVSMHELEKKLCIVGLWCIQMRSHDRPTMSDVIEMLEAGVDGLQMPPRPFFCDYEDGSVVDSYFLSELNAIEDDEE